MCSAVSRFWHQHNVKHSSSASVTQSSGWQVRETGQNRNKGYSYGWGKILVIKDLFNNFYKRGVSLVTADLWTHFQVTQ